MGQRVKIQGLQVVVPKELGVSLLLGYREPGLTPSALEKQNQSRSSVKPAAIECLAGLVWSPGSPSFLSFPYSRAFNSHHDSLVFFFGGRHSSEMEKLLEAWRHRLLIRFNYLSTDSLNSYHGNSLGREQGLDATESGVGIKGKV